LNFRFNHETDFRIYRRATVNIRSSARLTGRGVLRIGFIWPMEHFSDPLFSVMEHAIVIVHGDFSSGDFSSDDFSLHSGCRVIVGEGAILELGSGYVNSGSSISCDHAIEIGDPVWIGTNATILKGTILKGVTIGDGAIIAAGAVVTKNIPTRALAAGLPATILRHDVEWG
jgi:acetyltransferase-like isoleucine patch superfamily enzyme